MTGLTQHVIQVAQETHNEEHVTFKIQITTGTTMNVVQQAGKKLITDSCFSGSLMLNSKDFSNIFPYHIVFDSDLVIDNCGNALQKMFPGFICWGQTKLTDIAELVKPDVQLDFPTIVNFINGVFVFKTVAVLKSNEPQNEVENGWALKTPPNDVENRSVQLLLKGQMVLLSNGSKMLYICSPCLTTIKELLSANLRLCNVPLHDVTRDLILLNQQRLIQVEVSKRLKQTTTELKEIAQKLEVEKASTETLLCEVLPPLVAQQMVIGKTVDACEYSAATILFSDIPQFQSIVQGCRPMEIVALLNELFIRMDRLVGLGKLYKVVTVSDIYMVVGGVPEHSSNHAELVCDLALGIMWESRLVLNPISKIPLQVRIGIHSGPVAAGVVGRKMPRYCLFGDTVNTASRMGTHGVACRIHVSSSTKIAAETTGRFAFEVRGIIKVKGKGDMSTFFLLASKKRSLWEIIDRERAEDHSIDGYAELNDPSFLNAISRQPSIFPQPSMLVTSILKTNTNSLVDMSQMLVEPANRTIRTKHCTTM